jgi:hypothetical protein
VTATIPVGQRPVFIAIQKIQSSQDLITPLIAKVEALVGAGTLRQNQGAALINKLNEVRAKLNADQTNAACNQLGAFIKQVNAIINNSSLTQAQGQSLIADANVIKTVLGC